MRHRFTSTVGQVLLSLALAAVLAGCAVVAPQQTRRAPASPPPPPAAATPQPRLEGERIERRTSEPYAGELSIFEGPNREKNLQVLRVMDVLGIREGSSVADIGAGSGWFTVRAARRVGGAGAVYAVEINPDYLKHIAERAAKENIHNIRTVLGKEDDPLLPPASVDAVLMLKTYHEIAQPIRLLTRLREAMRPGALLGVIDRNGDGSDHGVSRETVIREAARAGFTLVEEHDFVRPDNMDYFLVFRLKE